MIVRQVRSTDSRNAVLIFNGAAERPYNLDKAFEDAQEIFDMLMNSLPTPTMNQLITLIVEEEENELINYRKENPDHDSDG